MGDPGTVPKVIEEDELAILHVSITGRDRRHLTALGAKLRVVVVGYREDKRGAVVDAYLDSKKVDWVRRQGYGVVVREQIDAHDHQRQTESREGARKRLRHGRYGDVIWGGGYLTAEEVEGALALGEKNHAGYFERIELPHLT